MVIERAFFKQRSIQRSPIWKMLKSRRYGLLVGGALVIASVICAVRTAPAAAARQITPPQWFACGTYYPGTISIGPPRIWSSYNRPEHVIWQIQIQRYSGSYWYPYGKPYITHSTFNWYGQSPTSWAAEPTSTGGRYVNSALHLRVGHVGWYRLAVAIGGTDSSYKWIGFVRGGARCYMR